MKVIKGLEKNWKKAVAVNSRDYYSKAMLDYLLKLTDLLEKEKKLTAGKLLDAMDKANDMKYELNQQSGAMILILKYWYRKDELNKLVIGLRRLFNGYTPNEINMISPVRTAQPVKMISSTTKKIKK